jgi:hypothetical protein
MIEILVGGVLQFATNLIFRPRARPILDCGVALGSVDLARRRQRWSAWARSRLLVVEDDGERIWGSCGPLAVEIDARVVKARAQTVVLVARGPSPFFETVWFKRVDDDVHQLHGRKPAADIDEAMRALFACAPSLLSYRWEGGRTTLRFRPTTLPDAIDKSVEGLGDLVRAAASTYRE